MHLFFIYNAVNVYEIITVKHQNLFLHKFCITLYLLVSSFTVAAETSSKSMETFRDARFGMFIHFGVTSQNRMEHTPEIYESVSREFNPVDFDATEWVKVAKDAGAKYIVLPQNITMVFPIGILH